MNRFPTCQQTFSDDISFCLQDGTPLGFAFDQHEHATIVRGDPVAQSAPPARSPFLTCSIIAVLCLILVGVIGGIIFALSYSSPSVRNAANQSNKDQDVINQQKANLQDQQAEIDRQKQEIANARKTLDDKKKDPGNRSTSPPHDQPPTRINFRRGSIEETVTGSVYVGRSYLFRTRVGQYLSGTVTSANDCVVFGNGATSAGYTTDSVDSSLTILNKCGDPLDFSLTVTIR